MLVITVVSQKSYLIQIRNLTQGEMVLQVSVTGV